MLFVKETDLNKLIVSFYVLYSFGRVLLTNYLARVGKDTRLNAGLVMSAPWNIFGSAKSLEQPFNAAVFNKYLCTHLKAALQRFAIRSQYFIISNLFFMFFFVTIIYICMFALTKYYRGLQRFFLS